MGRPHDHVSLLQVVNSIVVDKVDLAGEHRFEIEGVGAVHWGFSVGTVVDNHPSDVSGCKVLVGEVGRTDRPGG
jgi:hypothetical protein